MKARLSLWFPGRGPLRRLLVWGGTAALGGMLVVCLTGCGTEPAVASIPKDSANTARAVEQAGQAAREEAGETNASVPRSVFYAGLDARNPFFPNSKRRPVSAGSRQEERIPIERYLKLVGIRPGTARPMALINRTAFSPGEEGDVTIVVSNELSRAQVQKVNIRCLEIRRDSVLISITGEQGVKELRMAQGR